ncbi:hypothetical protein D3C73_797040 [compost metagenome]
MLVGRRQGPHAIRMVLGIARVGIDLGTRVQLETGGFGHRDHLLLAHITRVVSVGHVGLGAVLDHAEHAARLEHVEEALEHALRLAGLAPVVHVAERQHHIGRVGRAEHRLGRVVGDDGGLVELCRCGGVLLFQAVAAALLVVAAAAFRHSLRIDHRSDVMALVAQQRRQDFRVPAIAGRDLDDGLFRRHAEEAQRLRRMTETVALDVGRVAGRGLHCRIDRRRHLDLCRCDRSRRSECGNGDQQRRGKQHAATTQG